MKPRLAHELGGVLLFLVACGDALPTDSSTTSGGAGARAGGTTGAAGAPSTGGDGAGGSSGAAAGMGGGAGTQVMPPMAGTGGTTPTGGAAGTGGAVGTGGGGGSGAATLSFAADIWPVIDQTRNPPWMYRGTGSYDGCTTGGVCHGGPNPGARLAMTAADSTYRALVNVLSTTSLCAGTIRVVPGDPDRSCLVLFYQGRLKDDLGWVDQAEIELMRRWIAQGARP